ncbi:MAG: betaine/proline/choline family ABC transporter ATP-binding protein [Peptostreptococcaceae bacterium]|nr:betaine/proline/choline family ABC transporter ATP-binding protein [Peptostreptococcaceae bacterium]
MIELKNISKSYNGKTNVIENLNLTIEDGQLIVLVGESGCGKTTTMQMLNKLIEPSGGDILIDGKNINSFDKLELRRNIGYVIQDIGLFPHKTIEDNVATVPRLEKHPKTDIHERVKTLMQMVDLPYDEYAQRYPRELSGGQKQRIGVARALANDPDLILMDEPFSALDPITREQLQDELLKLHDELGKTIVFVTHDIDEAIKLGDKIAVMQSGKIVQFATPEEILKNPINEFVATFVGKNRLWKTPEMLTAEDVMIKGVAKVNPSRSVAQAIIVMKKHDKTVLAVVKKTGIGKEKLLGIVGANRFTGISDHNTKISDIMKSNVKRIPRKTPLTEVIKLRNDNNILFSPVVDEDDNLIGMITNTSIVNVLSQIMPGQEDY